MKKGFKKGGRVFLKDGTKPSLFGTIQSMVNGKFLVQFDADVRGKSHFSHHDYSDLTAVTPAVEAMIKSVKRTYD